MNVVNPPLPLATNHSPRCFAHRATDLNRCRVIIRNFETSLFATRSEDPFVKSPRSTDEKNDFREPTFPKYEQRVWCAHARILIT